jgi:hypothetical protein
VGDEPTRDGKGEVWVVGISAMETAPRIEQQRPHPECQAAESPRRCSSRRESAVALGSGMLGAIASAPVTFSRASTG